MRISLRTLNIALLAVGCGGLAMNAIAQSSYYDPTNIATPQGKTTGYELYKTIGCPGQGILDKGCAV